MAVRMVYDDGQRVGRAWDWRLGYAEDFGCVATVHAGVVGCGGKRGLPTARSVDDGDLGLESSTRR